MRVSPEASSSVSGSPISVLKLAALACSVLAVHRAGARRGCPSSRSCPTEPVIPTMRAPRARQLLEPTRREAGERGPRTAASMRRPRRAPRDAGPHARASRRRPRRRPRSRRSANSPPSSRSPASPKKRSPGATSRESTTARAGRPGGSRGRPTRGGRRRRPRSRSVVSSITLRGARARPKRLAGDLAVVERHLAAVLELLSLLVALAGDETDVARLASSTARSIALAAVGLDLQRRRAPARSAASAPSTIVRDDRVRVLGARVVRGDDHVVGEPPRRPRPSAAASRGRGRRLRRTRI